MYGVDDPDKSQEVVAASYSPKCEALSRKCEVSSPECEVSSPECVASSPECAAPWQAEVLAASPSPKQHSKATIWHDAVNMTLKRMTPTGEVQEAHLVVGPEGFGVASFPGSPTQRTSDVPNLILQSNNKNPAAADLKETCAPKKKPATKKKPAARPQGLLRLPRGSSNKKLPQAAGVVRRSVDDDRQRKGKSESLGQLRVTYATDQSYIQSQQLPGSKWSLVVSCKAKQSAYHAAIVEEIFKRAHESSLSKEDLVSLRDELVS